MSMSVVESRMTSTEIKYLDLGINARLSRVIESRKSGILSGHRDFNNLDFLFICTLDLIHNEKRSSIDFRHTWAKFHSIQAASK
jgi:hypothetical protein